VFKYSSVRVAAGAALTIAALFPSAVACQDAPRVSIHGYLTQGWGLSTGVRFYGLTDDASTDFRYAALQLRYAPTDNDQFVVQLNHRRLGRSHITDFESDVSLNWAFYQRGF
jgi:steroid 5-alpha reductase family enzyme